ncbi:uncharacterized protein [Cicer arietinum]|uniref:Uncharacterized protein LOC101501482 isoform X2 n=1 Tax=Cicer arietinum TaxID=3827 RepID=A0A1S2Z6M8_CICAR|nr:uncharacterized protein LOC101501482 isoform X2 [Cicer arietinum]
MALNKKGNLLGSNIGEFPQYTNRELPGGVTNVHSNNNIPKVGEKVSANFVHDGRVPVPDICRNRENGHVRYEDLTKVLGLKRMDSESSSDIGDFIIPKKHPVALEMENGAACPNISIKTHKREGESGRALRKTFSESISDQQSTSHRHVRSHSNGFNGSAILDDSLFGKMKFLCSFGGKILPRPGDGKLRYVGGETHIISIRNDISWQELMNKTLGICSQPHTIKYQLPGEDLDALISVSSDEDLQNMIEEYHGLESHEGSQKLRIFLVPFGESEETSSNEATNVLPNDPDYQYVVALNGLILDPSPTKKNIGCGQSMTTNEANQLGTGLNFTPSFQKPPPIVSSPFDGILNESLNPKSPLRISPTPVQVAGSSTGYIQLLGNNSCAGSIESNASFVTAQLHSGNSSISTSDCRYTQQAAVTLLNDGQHGDVGQLNGQYFDNYNPSGKEFTSPIYVSPSNGYGDEVFGGTLHNKERILYSENPLSCLEDPICQKSESYGTTNDDPPHGMAHTFSDSQLHESGARSQQGISQSISLNLEKVQLSSMLVSSGVSQVNLMEGQHDPFLHHPRIQSMIPKVESSEMHRRQDLSGSGFVDKDVQENSLKSERMMIIEEKNPIPKKDNNKVYEGNSTINYTGLVNELHLLDSFPTNNISAKISMQKNREQPFGDTHPLPSGMTGFSLNNLVDKTNDGKKCGLAEGLNGEQGIDFSARNIDLDAPIFQLAESFRDKSAVRDHTFEFSFDTDTLKSAQIQPSQNQINAAGTVNSESVYPTVLHDDICPRLNLRVDDDLDNSSKNTFSFKKEPYFLDDLISTTDQMVDQFKHELSSSGLSKVEDSISGRSKNSERFNDANRAEPSFVVEDVTGDFSSRSKSSHVFDEVGSDLSPSTTEVESTVPESDPEDFKDDQTDMNEFLSDAMIAEMEASIYGLQIIRNVDLEELMELGSGTYGTVYHGKWRGTDVAIKRIKKSCFGGRSSEQERLAKDFWREAQILSNLHHPNVLAFYGIVPDGAGGTLATVTEYMVNGSLRHVLVKNNRLLDCRKKLIIAMDAAFGMEYLHSKNIVHFDLKCDNLLVNLRDPQRPICKVGDFGLSRIKRNTLVSGGVRGTLPWMAPELLNGNSSRVSEKVDVFSFGISMWELLTGEEPYADMHCGAIIGGIVKNTLRPPIPDRCDPEWRKLMEECWSRDPECRPSFTEITNRLRSMSMALQGKGNYHAWQLRPSNNAF